MLVAIWFSILWRKWQILKIKNPRIFTVFLTVKALKLSEIYRIKGKTWTKVTINNEMKCKLYNDIKLAQIE